MMNWVQIQERLQLVANYIRQNKTLDAATVGLLEEIPVVGSFLSRYWDNLAPDENRPLNMTLFIEAMARQEESFNKVSRLVEAQGDELIKQGRTLGDILLHVDETRADVKAIKAQISLFVEVFQIPSARAAFELAAAMGEDHRQSSDLIQRAQQVLERAGHEADAHSYYLLGIVNLSMSEFENAEACLLEALKLQPDLVDALIGLAMIYQRRATEYLRQENYGLAQVAAVKSEAYVKSALQYEPTDVGLQVHLGYLYKDLAQRYFGSGKASEAQKMAEKAWACFETVLKVTPENASAHNGLGSLCLIRRDYDGAIMHCGRAVELLPDYLFAYFDLAIACYAKAMSSQGNLRLQTMLKGLEAYMKVIELDGVPGHDSLPHLARQDIDQKYQQVVAQVKRLPEASQIRSSVQGREETRRTSGDIAVRVAPQFLALVVGESKPRTAMFNLNCGIVNEGLAGVYIQRLEAEVTTPDGLKLRFLWNVFYRYDPSNLPENKTMARTSDAHDIAVEAMESKSLGIQFLGPMLEPQSIWMPGRYKFELYGWANRQPEHEQFNVETSFHVEIGGVEANQVRYWSGATKMQWDKLNDPDRAIAIPIRKWSLAEME
jgi:tetratricopeptide (TPR) repeat protein